MRTLLLICALLLCAARVEAQCYYESHNPSLTVSPSAAAVDTEQTGQIDQTYILELDDQDVLIGPQCNASCSTFTRKFCFRQEVGSDFTAPNTFERFLTVSPPGFTCVNLKPLGCGTSNATIAVFVQQDQGGTTPPHRYLYKTTVRSAANPSNPILASAIYAYSRHDFWGNTCQYQVQP